MDLTGLVPSDGLNLLERYISKLSQNRHLLFDSHCPFFVMVAELPQPSWFSGELASSFVASALWGILCTQV